MNYWIFQSTHDFFDLRDEGNLSTGQDGHWRATSYRSKMKIGDLIFFWMAGPSEIRGIYGWGHLTSLPYKESGKYRVDLKVDRRLTTFLPATTIKLVEKLATMTIFTVRAGSNFLISQDEARLIADLLAEPERPEEV